MTIQVDEQLRSICEEICSEALTLAEWSLVESSDMFQTASYCGRFDSTEVAFCFSYFDVNAKEFWFQFTLDEARKVLDGSLNSIEARLAKLS